jgi:cytochrome b
MPIAGSTEFPALRPVRVWDLPTRMFHWTLVGLVIVLVTTGKVGGEAMVWHGYAAYCVACLLLFRFCWGFVGGHWSRFRNFSASPTAVLDSVRGRKTMHTWVGHNPLGSLSVIAMLLVIAAQCLSGAFSADKGEYFGPLTLLVSDSTVAGFTKYHKSIGQFLVLSLVLLHVAAVGYYRYAKREDLIRPMLVGDKVLNARVPSSRDTLRTRLLALVIFLGSALTVMALLRWAA